jgi:hypothetical protein
VFVCAPLSALQGGLVTKNLETAGAGLNGCGEVESASRVKARNGDYLHGIGCGLGRGFMGLTMLVPSAARSRRAWFSNASSLSAVA